MWLRFTIMASGLAIAAACGGPSTGVSDANLAKAKSFTPPGNDVFQRACAGCHGKSGEGLSQAPRVIGAGALPTYKRDPSTSSNPAMQSQNQYRTADAMGADKRGTFKTALDVYNYTSTEMPLPQSKKGTLKPEEYWAVVNYMLVANGIEVPPEGVNEQNAASVMLRPAD